MPPKGTRHSPEARARNSESHKGRPLSLETRSKISASMRGRHLSPETRAKIGVKATERQKGKQRSPETRAKISESLRRKLLDPEVRAQRSERMRGKRRGPANPHWKGGRRKQGNGYMRVLNPNHPRADKQGYVPEHTLVWEEKHGRALPLDWVVHHLNGISDDNRTENLLACPKGNHHYALLLQGLQSRIRVLEAENKRLKLQGKLWD